jgi:AraC family transcriptional regulator
MTLPDSLLQTVAAESDLNAARMEIIDRWQVRDNELETLSWSIKREIDSGFPSGRVYLDGLTLAIASRLVMRHSSLARTNEQRQGGLVGQRLKQVLSFIEEQLGEDLSLEKIAAIARVSPSHLNLLFRKSIGLPVHRYVIQRRVERANSSARRWLIPHGDCVDRGVFASEPYGASDAAFARGVASGDKGSAQQRFSLALIFSSVCARKRWNRRAKRPARQILLS